jgi:phage terminase large subunit-like protein
LLPVESIARDYALGVVEGRIVAGKLVRLVCKRFLDELEKAEHGSLFFNGNPKEGKIKWKPQNAQKVMNFFSALKHSKGEWGGKEFQLAPWQIFILANLFGWMRDSDVRRFREVHIEVARKNGKSTFLAGIGLYLLVADGEPGAEIYSAATKKDQAKIVFDEAVRMRKASPLLASKIVSFRNNLHVTSTHSKFEPLSSEDDTLDGLNIHGALIDELHAHPNRKLYDVLFEATKSRRQPLVITITTAGWDRQGICWKQRQLGVSILEGKQKNDRFFPFIATIDEGDDWQDEKCWPKANPNFGISVKLDGLREGADKAKADPTALNSFLRKHLNIWTAQQTRWMPMEKWDACCENPTVDPIKLRQNAMVELKGRVCFGGLDLSSKDDLTVFVLLFPPQKGDNKWRILPWFWLPEETVQQRVKESRVSYDVWVREGFIETTPGGYINTEFIRAKIREIANAGFQIQEIGFDRWGDQSVRLQLENDGFKIEPVGQGTKDLSEPMKMFAIYIGNREVEHYNNPVLAWNVGNVEAEMDAAGWIKPAKNKSSEKIDGVSATLCAMNRAMANPLATEESVYLHRGVIFLEDAMPLKPVTAPSKPVEVQKKMDINEYWARLSAVPRYNFLIVRKDGAEVRLPRSTAAPLIAQGLAEFVREG